MEYIDGSTRQFEQEIARSCLTLNVHFLERGVLGSIEEIKSLASKKLHFVPFFEVCLTVIFAYESCTLFV